jgi:hypothetical protein
VHQDVDRCCLCTYTREGGWNEWESIKNLLKNLACEPKVTRIPSCTSHAEGPIRRPEWGVNGADKNSSRENRLRSNINSKDSYTNLPRSRSHNGPTNHRNKSQQNPKQKHNSRDKRLRQSVEQGTDHPQGHLGLSATLTDRPCIQEEEALTAGYVVVKSLDVVVKSINNHIYFPIIIFTTMVQCVVVDSLSSTTTFLVMTTTLYYYGMSHEALMTTF